MQAPTPVAPPPPPSTDWASAVKQLRDIAQWIIGGVVATAAGVFAGSPLTNLGKLDPVGGHHRLVLAAEGAVIGFVAIALIMLAGLAVVAPPGGSLRKLANARSWSTDGRARRWLYRMHGIKEAIYPLGKMLDHPDRKASQQYLPLFFEVQTFAVVRTKFQQLLWTMAIAVPLALAGFGLFAWAANPPEHKVEAKPIVVQLMLPADEKAWHTADHEPRTASRLHDRPHRPLR